MATSGDGKISALDLLASKLGVSLAFHRELPLACAAYAIVNKTNGRCYVGASKRLRERISSHVSALQIGNHCSPKMQADFAENGIEAFAVCILSACAPENIGQAEATWFRKLSPDYNTVVVGFDMCIDRPRHKRLHPALNGFPVRPLHQGKGLKVEVQRCYDSNTNAPLREIASACGVSVPTVSRLLRDKEINRKRGRPRGG